MAERAQVFEFPSIPHKAYDPNSILKVTDKEKERYLALKSEAFIETKPHKQNMLIFRAQESGIDPFRADLYKQTPGSPYPRKYPHITSGLIKRAVSIRSARIFGAFNSPHGDYVKVIPQRASAEDPALGMTHLINYYLRQDPYYKRKLAELAISIETNGVGITKHFWNFKQSVFEVNRTPTVMRDPVSGKLKITRRGNQRVQIITDRPEIEVIDPLFFAMPKGCKYLNRDGGAAMCFHLELLYNYELLDMEKRGYIENFKEILRTDRPTYTDTDSGSSEMVEFYDELFDDEMNKNVEPDDPYYRRWVTKIFEIPTDEKPVHEIWETNGTIIRKGIWKGGHELPYEVHVSDPPLKTWIGRSTPEKSQDNFRMLNYLLRVGLEALGESGKARLLVPESAGLSQVDLQRLANNEGPIKYNDMVSDGIGPKDKFLYLTPPQSAAGIFEQAQFLMQQTMEDLGISISEMSGADLPSAYRSGRLANILESQSGKAGGLAVSLVGESMQRMYNQIMTMIFRLQNQPVDIILNPMKPVIQTIDVDMFEQIPDMIAYPNIVTRELSETTIQSLSNYLPFMQGSINIPAFLKMLFQLGTSPEVARRFEEVMQQPVPPQQMMQQGQGTKAPGRQEGNPGGTVV